MSSSTRAPFLRKDQPAPAEPLERSFTLLPQQTKHSFALRVTKGRRTHIWEMGSSLHCSIIGTCLSTSGLRKLLGRVGIAVEGQTDHDLHSLGVSLAAQHNAVGKILNKILDDLHRVAIKKYGRAEDEAELRALWRQDVKSGDIPGGYWAVLSHPAATRALVHEVFGDVHMLSHLVGAANRADIHRLQQLEEQNAALADKVQRQQAQLGNAIVSRDAEIKLLRSELSKAVAAGDGEPQTAAPSDLAWRKLVIDLEHRLDSEIRRRSVIEQRLTVAKTQATEAQAAARAAERRLAALTAELEAAELSLKELNIGFEPAETEDTPVQRPNLAGRTILYVGGRASQIPHIRAVALRDGAAFLHHDGGEEDSGAVLASLIGRADLILFPVDCVSHMAVVTIKRLCGNMGKRYIPLRSGGISSFLAAIR